MPSERTTTEIVLEREGGWLTVWLDRPESRNALSGRMVAELAAVCSDARDDPSLRGITLRGRGGTFCSGGDIKGFGAILKGGAAHDAVAAFSRSAGELFHAMNSVPQVVVAVVEGAAMAGGVGLACAADIVIAARDARFGLTEALIGISPAQIAPLVAQRTGLAAARRIMLTAGRFDAAEAKALGLVDHIAEDAAGLAAHEAASRKAVLACAPGANAITKEILHATRTLSGGSMIEFAADRFARGMLSEEGREGISAFLEKRRPNWTA